MAEGADAVRRRNNVKVTGHGERTLVLAHGLGTDQTIWQLVVARLAADHRLVLFDYGGCGGADRAAYDPVRYATLDGYAEDLREVVESVGGPRPILVAHSISGALGIMSSIRAPALFERMVLLSPSPRFLDDPPAYRGGFTPSDVEDFLSLMEQNFLGWATAFSHVAAPGDGARRMYEAFCASDPTMLRSFARLAFHVDVRPLLPRVTTPALIVQCSDDAIAPRAVGELMRDAIPTSLHRVVEVIGHCPHVTHPELVEAVVRDYVRTSVA
jgi:sigma-B regulation protein RsbQ